MPRWLLGLINESFSRVTVGVFAFFGAVITVWTVVNRAASAYGISGGPLRGTCEVISSLAIVALTLLVLRPMRWSIVYMQLRNELAWFKDRKARILVGIGPGGAIIAGMIAKLLGQFDRAEPEVVVIDRVYSIEEYGEITVSVRRAADRLTVGQAEVGVVIVTSEIHSGQTIAEVCRHLRALQLPGLDNVPVFSFLWAPRSVRPPQPTDRFVLKSDERGILPWPDAPAKEPKG